MPVAIEARLDAMAERGANDGLSLATRAKQIEAAGATVLCRNCPDIAAAKALADFVPLTALAVAADIGVCDPLVAHAAMDAGAAAIWFEPPADDEAVAFAEIAALAHAYGCAVGLSVCGPHISNEETSASSEQAVARYAMHHVEKLRAAGIADPIVSLRLPTPAAMAAGARALARSGDFPIALSIGRAQASRASTANVAGTLSIGLPLLLGIGDMLCLPELPDPTADVHAAVAALRSIGLRPRGVAVTTDADLLRRNPEASRLPSLVEERLQHISRSLDVSLSPAAGTGSGPLQARVQPTVQAGVGRLRVDVHIGAGQKTEDTADRIARAIELATIELDAPDLEGLAKELAGSPASDDSGLQDRKLWARIAVSLRHVFRGIGTRIVWGNPVGATLHARLVGRRNEQQSGFGPDAAAAAVSTAIGLAIADRAAGRREEIIVVVERASADSGAMYEALRACRALGVSILVIAVDPAGGEAGLAASVAGQLARIVSSPPYLALREIGKQIVQNLPGPGYALIKRLEESGRGLASGGTLYDELGLYYVGPIPTRELGTLLSVLHNLSRSARGASVLLHLVGRSSNRPTRASAQENLLDTWVEAEVRGDAEVAIIDVGSPPRLSAGLQRHVSGRYFPVAEAIHHGIGLAMGLAGGGKHPYVFLDRRAFWRGPGEIAREIVRRGQAICFVVDLMRGYAPEAWFDAPPLGLETIPGFVVLGARDGREFALMLSFARKVYDRPVLIAHTGTPPTAADPVEPIEFGRGVILDETGEVAVLAIGRGIEFAQAARRILAAKGIALTIADARFAQPFDRDLAIRLFETHRLLIVVDDPQMAARIAPAVADALAGYDAAEISERLQIVAAGRSAAKDIVSVAARRD